MIFNKKLASAKSVINIIKHTYILNNYVTPITDHFLQKIKIVYNEKNSIRYISCNKKSDTTHSTWNSVKSVCVCSE